MSYFLASFWANSDEYIHIKRPEHVKDNIASSSKLVRPAAVAHDVKMKGTVRLKTVLSLLSKGFPSSIIA
jgi:hypothetical protein